MSSTRQSFTPVCALDDVLPNGGACALVEGRQIAIFRVDEELFALDNFDPASAANVLSRGIVGDLEGERVVASPLYKHHYCLATGRCLEDASQSVNVYPVRVMDGRVWVDTQPQRRSSARRRRLVVIGNGMAGMRTVEELLELAPEAYEITVLGAETRVNYNRILLSPVLAGEKRAEDIILHPPQWYAEHRVALHMGDPVVEIDRRRRLVRSRSGRETPYDRLLIATGATAIVLPIPGAQLPGVVTFRDLDDVEAMLEQARRCRRAAVIGGGLLGLEAAVGLARRGLDVTVVHLLDTLMERQLDAAAGQLLKSALETRGLRFRMQTQTVAVKGMQRAEGLQFEDGSELETDLVVMAAGIRPNIELAYAAGLRCERGILVDDTMQTYDPSIYAVGECVQHRSRTFGLVAPLWEQARVCGAHLAEIGVRRYRGTICAARLKVSGIDLYSAGDFSGAGGGEALVLRDPRRRIYKRLVIRDDRLCGAVLYGDARHGEWYLELMTAGENVAPLRDQLLFGPSAASGAGSIATVD
ncbi:MAG: nitrite reductase small subunit NirD [Steroidobacteraceae bacterium]